MFNRLLTQASRFLPTRPARARFDPNTPIALYYEPGGRVRPVTMKSVMGGGWGGEYDAVNQSMTRNGNATPSEIGYAYISEVNVWVRRCIEIRASNIKRLDWYVEDRRTGKRIDDHPLTIAMNRSRHFFQRAERSLMIWGELYVKPLKNEYGFYSDVQWLNNLSVNFNIVNGFIDQFFYTPLHGGVPHKWDADQMCYIYTENSFDDLRGSSKILAVLQEANVHEEIARAAQAHFANDARAGILFFPETDMGTDKAQAFMDYWKANFQGSWNVNRPVMMPMTIKEVKTLERAPLKDDVEFRGSIRREICAGMGVPLSVAGAWDDASYQSAPEQRKSLYEDTVIPEGEQIADDLSRSLLPFFGNPERERVWFDAKNLLALAEDRQQKAAALNSQLVSGGILVNEYREAMDMEAIPQGNVFYVPNGITVTPIEKLGTMPPPPLPGGGGFGMNSAPQLPAPAGSPALPPSPEEPVKAAGSMAILLSLANNVDLIGLQKRLKELFPDPSMQWTDPSEFHITLVYVPSFDEANTPALTTYAQSYVPPEMALSVGSLASFDNVGSHALHFRIPRNSVLMDCQEELHAACESLGLQMSAHSLPSQYKPHITMGYSPTRIPITRYQGNLRVTPDALEVSVEAEGQYTVVHRAALTQPDTIPAATDAVPVNLPAPETPAAAAAAASLKSDTSPRDAFLDELDAYEKFVLNRWNKPTRAFEFHILPVDVRTELHARVSACTEKAQVKQLFEGLREVLKQTADELKASRVPLEEDDADIVTPEQAQAWWHDYDRLMTTLGHDWLRDYMREVWRKLEGRLSREITADDVQALLEDFHPDLIQKWTGSADDPGVIAKLFMAGMGAGQAALVRKRTNMNPQKAAPIVDWTLIPQDAIAAVETYVGKLIKGIDKTTLADVQKIIAEWLESGGSIADLAQQLNPIFNDPARSEKIAATEASNAYNRGAVQRWADAGVTQMKFKTVQDSKVCDICRPLAGAIGTLEEGWWSDELGEFVFIPVHGFCRCFASPVI